MRLSGIANLPLHGGTAPPWLFKRMVELAKVTSEALVIEFGTCDFLRRLSNPYWFQSYSCVLGFDWHSSGTTTVTCGALKEALAKEDIGVIVAGGKGRASRKTPAEIISASDKFSLGEKKSDELVRASRLSAKVDNACVQDGYDLYHHAFFLSERGDWAVVQQGRNEENKYARRYHWLSAGVKKFVLEPHEGIASMRQESSVLDMTSKESECAQKVSADIAKENPAHLQKYFSPGGQMRLLSFSGKDAQLPSHHPVLNTDMSKQGWKALKRAYEIQPKDYEELVSLSGIGPKTIRALALVSSIVYGKEPSWKDPAKYSFAHGGKDGYPYPVDCKLMETSTDVLKNAIDDSKIGGAEKMRALMRLAEFAA